MGLVFTTKPNPNPNRDTEKRSLDIAPTSVIVDNSELLQLRVEFDTFRRQVLSSITDSDERGSY